MKQNLKHITSFLIITLLIATSVLRADTKHFDAGKLPYRLKEVSRFGGKRVTDFLSLDLENDGRDEILCLFEEKSIQNSIRLYRDFGQSVVSQYNFTKERITHLGPYFITDGGEKRICVGVKDAFSVSIYLFDEHLRLIKKMLVTDGIDIHEDGIWDGMIYQIIVCDIEHDGYSEILCSVNTGYDKRPRGLFIYSLKNDKWLWHFFMGATLNTVTVGNVLGDNKDEILIGCSAPNNGVTDNDIDDSHSWLILLNAQGQSLWKRQTGYTFSSNNACFYQKLPGKKTVILNHFVSRGTSVQPPHNAMQMIEPQTGSIEKEFSLLSLPTQNYLVQDLNNDMRKEILICENSASPGLIALTDSLNLLKHVELPYFYSDYHVFDLDHDGKPEICLLSKNPQSLIVLNNTLEITDYLSGPVLKLQNIHRGTELSPYLAVLASESGIVLYDYTKNGIHRWIPSVSFSKGVLAGILICFAVFFVIQTIQAVNSPLRAFWEIFEALPLGIIIINPRRRVIFCSSACHKYLNIQNQGVNSNRVNQSGRKLKTCDDLPVPNPSILCQQGWQTIEFYLGTRFFHAIILPVRRLGLNLGYLYVIEDQTQKQVSERALLWSSLAQKLTHEIKNPLSTVLLTLQRLQMAYHEDRVVHVEIYDKYTQSVIEEVERLRRVTDGFMKITRVKPPEFVRFNTHSLIKQIAVRCREWIPDSIEFKTEFERLLPDVSVDIDQMHALFHNLIDNAVKSIERTGKIFLRVTFDESIDQNDIRKQVHFEFSDTGCGMSAEQLKTIFEPYVSYREKGTGLGLTICREIVQDHNGVISIESKIDVGTTVHIWLPAQESDGKSI